MKHFLFIPLLTLLLCRCRHKAETAVIQFPGKPGVPAAIQKEHDQLLNRMHAFTLFNDSTGMAAVKLHELIQHHFKEEEISVLPALGLLPVLAGGQLPVQTNEHIPLTAELNAVLSHLKVEHQLIKAYMDELLQAASREGHPEIAEYEKDLQQHAQTEEAVFFPAAILVAEYLKLKKE